MFVCTFVLGCTCVVSVGVSASVGGRQSSILSAVPRSHILFRDQVSPYPGADEGRLAGQGTAEDTVSLPPKN